MSEQNKKTIYLMIYLIKNRNKNSSRSLIPKLIELETTEIPG